MVYTDIINITIRFKARKAGTLRRGLFSWTLNGYRSRLIEWTKSGQDSSTTTTTSSSSSFFSRQMSQKPSQLDQELVFFPSIRLSLQMKWDAIKIQEIHSKRENIYCSPDVLFFYYNNSIITIAIKKMTLTKKKTSIILNYSLLDRCIAYQI